MDLSRTATSRVAITRQRLFMFSLWRQRVCRETKRMKKKRLNRPIFVMLRLPFFTSLLVPACSPLTSCSPPSIHYPNSPLLHNGGSKQNERERGEIEKQRKEWHLCVLSHIISFSFATYQVRRAHNGQRAKLQNEENKAGGFQLLPSVRLLDHNEPGLKC